MATSAPLRSLEEEVTCSICLDYLRDPVTIDCGHVFCRSCTTDVRPLSGGRPVCPLCKKPFKKENIRPVWQLASLVENIERLKVDKARQLGDVAREQQDAQLCERHQEKLHYYCEDDGKLLCVMCRESREHRPHTAVLVEKAAQPHREKMLNHLGTLRRDRDKIQGFQAKGEADILAALDTRDYVNRYPRKKFWLGKPIPHMVKRKTGEFSDKVLSLQRGLREFQGKLLRDLEYKTVSVTLDPQSASGYLQLSEDWTSVAYSSLYQSTYLCPQQFDCEPAVLGSKGFTWGKVYWEVEVEREGWSEGEGDGDEEEEGEEEEEEEEEEEPGYRDGYEDWETDEDEDSLGEEEQEGEEEEEEEEEEALESCMVGVARDSVKRKGEVSLRPEDGVWALRLSSSSIWANSSPEMELFPTLRPRRVGIALDYEGGTVTFTNAESQELIHTFTAAFTGRLVPFLWLRWPGTRLLLRP
ncbi:tripartite motif-containing protein 26 isoform X1 [Heterocephalus glaber]|uniref:Tripartite motif-containing protein 26 isoform X1 n=1 Tax=Heterocephalus glaber TaxID=10181 RepID=A0AAX6T7E7_HETGA|nr:tripartite motif-containing protein 26 isoform X1 [Heterocephalus glaber]